MDHPYLFQRQPAKFLEMNDILNMNMEMITRKITVQIFVRRHVPLRALSRAAAHFFRPLPGDPQCPVWCCERMNIERPIYRAEII